MIISNMLFIAFKIQTTNHLFNETHTKYKKQKKKTKITYKAERLFFINVFIMHFYLLLIIYLDQPNQ
jgi:hypothetical protein